MAGPVRNPSPWALALDTPAKKLGSPWAGIPYVDAANAPTQADISAASDTSPAAPMMAPVPVPSSGPSLPGAGPMQMPSLSLAPMDPNSLSRAIGLGSRDKFENKEDAKQQAESRTLENTYLTPEQLDLIATAAQNTKPVQEQKQYLDEIEKFNQGILSSLPVQTNLKPLLSLVDSWTGSKLANGYKEPESAEDRAKMLMTYGENAKKEKEDLLNRTLQLAQYMKSGTTMNQLQNSLGMSALVGNFRPPSFNPSTNDWHAVDHVTKLTTDYQNNDNSLNALGSALQAGDLQRIQGSLALAARALNGDTARITNKHLDLVLPPTVGRDAASVFAYISNNPNVKLDPQIVQGLKQELGAARQRLYQHYQAELGSLKTAVGASPNLGSASNIIRAGGGTIAPPPAAGPTQADAIGKAFDAAIAKAMGTAPQPKGKK